MGEQTQCGGRNLSGRDSSLVRFIVAVFVFLAAYGLLWMWIWYQEAVAFWAAMVAYFVHAACLLMWLRGALRSDERPQFSLRQLFIAFTTATILCWAGYYRDLVFLVGLTVACFIAAKGWRRGERGRAAYNQQTAKRMAMGAGIFFAMAAFVFSGTSGFSLSGSFRAMFFAGHLIAQVFVWSLHVADSVVAALNADEAYLFLPFLVAGVLGLLVNAVIGATLGYLLCWAMMYGTCKPRGRNPTEPLGGAESTV